jgi:Kef-type K+ transport system membrane component KefB
MVRSSVSENLRKVIFYLLFIGAFTLLIFFVLDRGFDLEAGRAITVAPASESELSRFLSALANNFSHPLAILLAQVVTIIVVARFFGFIFRKIGQPGVVGEIIAGIVLGPSLLGKYFPNFSSSLFPVESLTNLNFLSQLGLILFMFVIGIELDLKVLRNKAHDALVISHASIVVPFASGVALAYFIYSVFAPPQINFISFALFMGIAMSITAFPVLARIVQERGIQKSRVGTIAITCAAADDITAWCMLAAVIAIVKAGSMVSALYTIGLAIMYVVVMVKVVKPFLKRIGDLHASQENLSKPVVGIFFLTLILSSYATEVIGIHALFGAFLTGTIIPENPKFRSVFIEKVEDVAIVLLLPLFFVFTGLRTQIGLLDSAYLWQITGLIILVAVGGKFLGSALAAKFVGQSWRDSLVIGTLMNTRGLMELVVLNIGFDLGVLTPEIFAMMVIMALVTTMMTGPGLDLINRVFKKDAEAEERDLVKAGKYRILISFANPQSGKSLLKLAHHMTQKNTDSSSITVMHLTPATELHQYNMADYEQASFAPILEESRVNRQEVTTLFKASGDIESDIAETANRGEFDLMLMGIGHSIYEGSLLGKILGFTTGIINPEKIFNKVMGRERLFVQSPFDARTQEILGRTRVPVGILLDKKNTTVDRIFIPFHDGADAALLSYARRFIHNSKSQVSIADLTGQIKNTADLRESIRIIEQNAPNHISVLRESQPTRTFLAQQTLMILTADTWKHLLDSKASWLTNIPSTLIISGDTNK